MADSSHSDESYLLTSSRADTFNSACLTSDQEETTKQHNKMVIKQGKSKLTTPTFCFRPRHKMVVPSECGWQGDSMSASKDHNDTSCMLNSYK